MEASLAIATLPLLPPPHPGPPLKVFPDSQGGGAEIQGVGAIAPLVLKRRQLSLLVAIHYPGELWSNAENPGTLGGGGIWGREKCRVGEGAASLECAVPLNGCLASVRVCMAKTTSPPQPPPRSQKPARAKGLRLESSFARL